MPTFKDIDLLVAGEPMGSEKLPVSALLYVTIQQIANIAVKDISEVTDSLAVDVNAMKNANTLSPLEKQYLKLLLEIVVTEKTYVDAKTHDTSIDVASFDDAFNDITNYLTPLTANINASSVIDRDIFNTKITAYLSTYRDILGVIYRNDIDLSEYATKDEIDASMVTYEEIGESEDVGATQAQTEETEIININEM